MPQPGGLRLEERTRRRAVSVAAQLRQVNVSGDPDVLAATLDVVEEYLDLMEARRRAAA